MFIGLLHPMRYSVAPQYRAGRQSHARGQPACWASLAWDCRVAWKTKSYFFHDAGGDGRWFFTFSQQM